MFRFLFWLPLAHVLLCTTLSAGDSETIHLDGDFNDWSDADQVASDPVGDATGAFDLSRISARVAGSQVFLRFDTQQELNMQSGAEDDGTLRLIFSLSNGRSLEIDFRERLALLRTRRAASTVTWSDLRFACLPTYAARDFELRLDLKAFGVRANDQVTLRIDGSDEIAKPITLTIGHASAPPTHQVNLDSPPDSVRVASLNTLKDGSADPVRAPVIKQLFDFADADIYCFNEAFDEETFKNSYRTVLPKAIADVDQVHWAASCGIASRFPLTPLAFECREAAALIHLPGERGLVIVSAHFECCGFAGSREDRKRIREVNHLVDDLRRVRSGEFGDKAAASGVIVLGDFNLVGSRTPLDLINAAGLTDVMLTCPVDGSAMTWRGITPSETFWPGRLDYVTVDLGRLRPTGGFIINSEQLAEWDQTPAADVPASDHSMLVIDIQPH